MFKHSSGFLNWLVTSICDPNQGLTVRGNRHVHFPVPRILYSLSKPSAAPADDIYSYVVFGFSFSELWRHLDA